MGIFLLFTLAAITLSVGTGLLRSDPSHPTKSDQIRVTFHSYAPLHHQLSNYQPTGNERNSVFQGFSGVIRGFQEIILNAPQCVVLSSCGLVVRSPRKVLGRCTEVVGRLRKVPEGAGRYARAAATRSSRCSVVLWSGCPVVALSPFSFLPSPFCST